MQPDVPFFSVIVPTYNRPGQLADNLRSLASLDYPRERFEVLIVDDGSACPLDPVLRSFRGALDLTLLRQRNRGPAAARNAGAARARGELLAFTDDDCRPAPGWLRALAKCLGAAPDRAVGGRTVNALPANPYSAATQLLLEYVYEYCHADVARGPFFASNNLALRADRFQTIGGFDIAFPRAAAEDRDLCDRWIQQGYQLAYAPEAVVYHAHPLSFRTFCRLHFNYGRGAFTFHRARDRRGSRSLLVRPPFYLKLPLSPLRGQRGRRALWLSALLALSQGANGAGFAWESFVTGPRRARRCKV